MDSFIEMEDAGATLRYATPSPLVRTNVEALLTREPTTIPWLRAMRPGDVFIDVGANVGLYSVYAARVSGARVFAFEPESQNYAVLNQNIYLNALHDDVTAYCVALSDRAEVSSLFLCTFAVGFGHHDFGESSWATDLVRGPVIYPKDERLEQGAISMTLDGLVESGALPVPNHIKIDVDGFEWKVLAGATRTLARPEVRSVLIETDFTIDGCVETVRTMTARGWHYSEDQVRVFQHEVVDAGVVGERIKVGSGQQNFIYYRDFAKYEPLFAEYRAEFTRGLASGVPHR